MIIVGIDPGVTGAISWLDGHGDLIAVVDMPVVEVKVGKTMRRRLVPGQLAMMFDPPNKPDVVFLEQVATRPGEGAVGAFSFGRGFGQIEGVLAAMEIPYHLVLPTKWKNKMGLPADKGSTVLRCIRTWPQLSALFTKERGKVNEDQTIGRADAAMIGLYGTGVAS